MRTWPKYLWASLPSPKGCQLLPPCIGVVSVLEKPFSQNNTISLDPFVWDQLSFEELWRGPPSCCEVPPLIPLPFNLHPFFSFFKNPLESRSVTGSSSRPLFMRQRSIWDKARAKSSRVQLKTYINNSKADAGWMSPHRIAPCEI